MVVFVVKLKAVAVQMDCSHVLHTMVNLSLQLVMVEQHWIPPGWLTVSVKIQAEDTSVFFLTLHLLTLHLTIYGTSVTLDCSGTSVISLRLSVYFVLVSSLLTG